MAQKFITKRNRHLFRKPVKVTVQEKLVIELPEIKESPISTVLNIETPNTIVEPTVIDTNSNVVETIVEDEPKKRKTKKSKDNVEKGDNEISPENE